MSKMATLMTITPLSINAQVLWGEERAVKGLTVKQSFVDLGCGNGLLVHILSNEGVCVINATLGSPEHSYII